MSDLSSCFCPFFPFVNSDLKKKGTVGGEGERERLSVVHFSVQVFNLYTFFPFFSWCMGKVLLCW